jgi:hypothetical protein
MDLWIFKKWFSAQNRDAKQRRIERERSNIRGAPALREPWYPWTRGETLLPSRVEAKEEEEGGVISPALSWWHQNGNHCDDDLHQQLRRSHHQLSPPICSGVTSLLLAVICT